jgi:hypothetical protein
VSGASLVSVVEDGIDEAVVEDDLSMEASY